MHLLSEVADVYLPSGHPRAGAQDAATAEQWRRRYRAAVEVLRGAGIATATDEARGAERYVDQRRRWGAHAMAVARYMEFRPDEIDPIGARPAATGNNREMPTQPLRAAG